MELRQYPADDGKELWRLSRRSSDADAGLAMVRRRLSSSLIVKQLTLRHLGRF